MNLSISAHHVNVTEAIESYLRNKMNRIARHFEHSIDINIILSVSKHEHKAEAKLHFYGRDLFCESVELNLYKAIDDLVIKADRKILKLKNQVKRYSTESIRRRQVATEPA